MKNKYGMEAGWWQIKIYDILGQDIAEARTNKKMVTISIDKFKFLKQCCSEKAFNKEIKFESELIKRKNKKDLVKIYFHNEYSEGIFTYSEFNTNVCKI